MRRAIGKKTIDEIFRLRDKGLTYKAIVQETGVSMKTVYLILNQKTKEDTIRRNEKIVELRAKNMTHQEIADIVKCHRQTVGSVLQKQEGYVKGFTIDKRRRKAMWVMKKKEKEDV